MSKIIIIAVLTAIRGERKEIAMSNKKKSEDLHPAEKRRMICDIQALGKMLLTLNGGKDISFTCVDGRGKDLISGSK